MIDHPAILYAFWPFTHAALLLWGLAAAVPILIHLWSRRRYRETTWAAMQFLAAALKNNARRMRIEQLLLLAVRTAILILLAIALANPVLSLLPHGDSAATARGSTYWVLVMDTSYSMATQPDQQSWFDAARSEALAVVERSRQGDGFSLVALQRPPRVIIGEPAFAASDVAAEIEGLEIRHTDADLTATLAEVTRLARDAAERHPRLEQMNVAIFSDLGRNTWEAVDSTACRAVIGELAELAALQVVDVGQSQVPNAAITQLRSDGSTVIRGQSVRFDATIENFSTQDMGSRQVEFLVDGRPIQRRSVNLPAGAATTASFTHRFVGSGDHAIEARLEDDPLPIDNRRFLSVPVRDAVRVLCIWGRSGASRHIALALAPDAETRQRIEVTERPESALLEENLYQYDCVVLANVGRLGRDEAAVLLSYVQAGGGLITFLGDLVQAESYNDHLAADEDGALRVLPARLGAVQREESLFDPIDYRHPIVGPFERFERSGLLTTPVWRYFQLHPFRDQGAREVLRLTSGHPAIVEKTIGRGRSLLVATDASPQSRDETVSPPIPWSALASWPSFPPLIQEMVAYCVDARQAGRNVMVGDRLQSALPNAAGNVPLTVVDPRQREGRVPVTLDGEVGRWSYADTFFQGIYRITEDDDRDEDARQLFAVNVDTQEGKLERYDAQLLPSQFRQQTEPQPAAARTGQQGAGVALFRLLLLGVLGLLLTEQLLAWRFGRPV